MQTPVTAIDGDDPISLSIICRRLRAGQTLVLVHRGNVYFILSLRKATGSVMINGVFGQRVVPDFYSMKVHGIPVPSTTGHTLTRGDAVHRMKFSTECKLAAARRVKADLFITLLDA